MLTRPAKLLPVHFTLGSPQSPDADGKYYRYSASLLMDNPVDHSDISYNNVYTLANLNVGDYVATDGAGRIMKVVAIDAQDLATASITVEDEFRLNQQQDSTGNSVAYIDSGIGVVFEVLEGKPILFPYSDKSTTIVGFIKEYADEIQSRFSYLRQDSLVSIEQAHSFVVGDLITYKSGAYELLDTADIFLGTVVEIDNPVTGSFRFRPTGNLLNIALSGAGPYFWWDPATPGKLTDVYPSSSERRITVFYKLSATQAIYFAGSKVLNDISGYMTLDTAQTVTSEKTFDEPQHFTADVDITSVTGSTNSTSGALIVTGGVGIGENLYVGQNLNISGNFEVSGTTTILDTTNLAVTDKLIELGAGTIGIPSGDSGIVIERGDSDNIFIGWDESADVVAFATGAFTGASTGNLTLTDANIKAGEATLTSAIVTDLTDNRIVLAGTNGALEDSANLTFDGTDLTLTGNLAVTSEATLGSAVVSDLTDNRIVIAGTLGALEDDANFTFDGTDLSVGANIEVTGDASFGTDNTNTFAVNSSVSSDLVPDTTNIRSLGSNTINWNEAWINDLNISGTSTITGPVAFTTGTVVVSNADNVAIDHTIYVMYATTIDGTQTELFLNNSNTRITMVNNSTMMFEADVIGRDSTGTAHTSIKLQGVIDRTANITTIIGDVNKTIIADTGESWVVDASADDTNDTLIITVIGDTSTIRWTAFVKTTRITH
tara:strand:- start:113 stop:2266 length:2154 start_codon:yes stop_codon:yes gene_type:complete